MKWSLPLLLALLLSGQGCQAGVAGAAESGSNAATADAGQAKMDPATEREIDVWNESRRAMQRKYLSSLAARNDADALLAATLLWPQTADHDNSSPDDDPPPHWLALAKQLQPRDTNVAWIRVTHCYDGCDLKGALDFLLVAEADNAAVQLLAMVLARDEEEQERFWEAAADSRVYDNHARRLGALLHAAAVNLSVPPIPPSVAAWMGRKLELDHSLTEREMRNVQALEVWRPLAAPDFQAITDRCKPEEAVPMDAVLKAQCQRVLELLADDESSLDTPMVALHALVELEGGTPQGLVWRERLRQLYWLSEKSLPGQQGHGERSGYPEGLERILLEGEIAAMRHVLDARKLPLAAPAGWVPNQPGWHASWNWLLD